MIPGRIPFVVAKMALILSMLIVISNVATVVLLIFIISKLQ